MYKLKINLNKDEVVLELADDDKLIDSSIWSDSNNLSRKLLVKIDLLLKKNRITPQDLGKVETHSEIPDRFTSNRIVEIIAKTFNFANEKKE